MYHGKKLINRSALQLLIFVKMDSSEKKKMFLPSFVNIILQYILHKGIYIFKYSKISNFYISKCYCTLGQNVHQVIFEKALQVMFYKESNI